jgi:hypothetical protein
VTVVDTRGYLHSRDRARQLLVWPGWRYGKISPTNIDFMLEYHDEAFIFGEIKLRETTLCDGQVKAFLRTVNRIEQAGARALLLIASHDVDDPERDVYVPDCIVRETYSGGMWRAGNGQTVRHVIDLFLGHKSLEDV